MCSHLVQSDRCRGYFEDRSDERQTLLVALERKVVDATKDKWEIEREVFDRWDFAGLCEGERGQG